MSISIAGPISEMYHPARPTTTTEQAEQIHKKRKPYAFERLMPDIPTEKKGIAFSMRVDLFFVGHGHFVIRERIARRIKEIKDQVSESVGIETAVKCLIDSGFSQVLLKKKAIAARAQNGYWTDSQIRAQWTVKLVEYLCKDPCDMSKEDFEKNGLRALIGHCRSSPFIAISEAFPELGLKEWEMRFTQKKCFEKMENRIAATKWLAERVGKQPFELETGDFYANGLHNLIDRYGGSPLKAVQEAYPELKAQGWDMGRAPNGFYHSQVNRLKAFEFLLRSLKGKKERTAEELELIKRRDERPESLIAQEWHELRFMDLADPRTIRKEHFTRFGVCGLLKHYNERLFDVVSALMPSLGIKEWEMQCTPKRFFANKEHRVEATRWLVETKLKINPRDVTKEDFINNGLSDLLKRYGNSPYAALIDAYPEEKINPWEMKKTPDRYFESDENKIRATRWLVDTLKIDPRELMQAHFNDNRLSNLIDRYNGSPFAAVSHAYPELGIKIWEMGRTPNGFYKIKQNRIDALHWLVETKLKIPPDQMTKSKLCKNGFSALLDYNECSIRKVMAEGYPDMVTASGIGSE